MACPTSKPLNFSSEPFPVTSSDYQEILSRWTKKKELYPDNQIRMFLNVTYLSWEWREAAIALLSSELSRDEVESALFREQNRKDYQEFHEFFVRFYTQPRTLNDLHKTSSQWRVSLLDDQGRNLLAKPEDIELISDGLRGLDVTSRILYPYADEFSFYYRVRFPRVLPDGTLIEPTEPNGRLTLRLSSVIGKTDLNWISTENL